MSGPSEALVRLAARTLPAMLRGRYREEWLADLEGAAEAGVSRSSIVLGALSTAVTIDRLHPSTRGMTLSRAFAQRLRTAGGFGLAAALLAIGSDAYAGFPTMPLLGAGLTGLALALAVVAAVAMMGAVRAAVVARRPVAAVLVLVAALGLVAVVVTRLGTMLVILAAAPAIAGLVAVAVLLTGGRLASTRGRILAATVIPLVALGVAALGLVHVFVWNPLAKLPGMTLAEIYAGLAAAGEGPIGGPTGWVVIVGILTVVASVAYAAFVLAPVRAWRRHRTRRRLLALGLLVVGGVVTVGFLPAFTMGMGIADAFMTSGGDAAGTGGLLAVVGMLAFAGTILVSFVRVEPGPPEGLPSRA